MQTIQAIRRYYVIIIIIIIIIIISVIIIIIIIIITTTTTTIFYYQRLTYCKWYIIIASVITTRVRQGGVLAPFLFIILVDHLLGKAFEADSRVVSYLRQSRQFPVKSLDPRLLDAYTSTEGVVTTLPRFSLESIQFLWFWY